MKPASVALFFSDGAPSDQHRMECEHGVKVWQEDAKANPKLGHLTSRDGWRSRQARRRYEL
jgi:hypothetical protein